MVWVRGRGQGSRGQGPAALASPNPIPNPKQMTPARGAKARGSPDMLAGMMSGGMTQRQVRVRVRTWARDGLRVRVRVRDGTAAGGDCQAA